MIWIVRKSSLLIKGINNMFKALLCKLKFGHDYHLVPKSEDPYRGPVHERCSKCGWNSYFYGL